MNRIEKINRVIGKNGSSVEILYKFGTVKTFAFIQPAMYKNKMYIDNEQSPIGEIDESCYIYIGHPDYALPDGTVIIRDCKYFVTVKSDVVYGGTGPAYVWAILRRKITEGQYE
jgi:hypothetical protein